MKKNPPFLKIRDLAVEYTAEGQVIHAVNGVSLELHRGQTLGLVGETGAGKTTIAKSIMRILPVPPAMVTGGEIWFDGVDLLQANAVDMRKVRGQKISMIFQDPMTALNPVMCIGNQIAEVYIVHNHVSKREAREKAVEMLELVGIPSDRYHEYPHQFSGGMRQRVVIAIALACNPELILADEPTTALDVTIQAEILEMINDLKKAYNTSMIMITHDLGVVAKVCDTVAVVYAGQVVEYGSRVQLFDHPLHPYTLGLFGAIPDLKVKTIRLHPISGMLPDPSNLPEGCFFSPRCPYATAACTLERIPMTEVLPGHFCRCINFERQTEGQEA